MSAWRTRLLAQRRWAGPCSARAAGSRRGRGRGAGAAGRPRRARGPVPRGPAHRAQQHGVAGAGRAPACRGGSGSPVASMAAPPTSASRTRTDQARAQHGQRRLDDLRTDAVTPQDRDRRVSWTPLPGQSRRLFVGGDERLLANRNVELVEALQQAVPRERRQREPRPVPARQRHPQRLQVDRHLGARRAQQARLRLLRRAPPAPGRS